MHIQLVGGGGREHALAWLLHRHGHTLAFTHDNPAFAALGRVERIDRPDLVVIGPEAPLAEGMADVYRARGIPVFGPSQAASRLETSKVYTKEFCWRHGLPTGAAQVLRPGQRFHLDGPAVVKLDGLAAGKGVWVCDTAAEAARAVEDAFAARPDAQVLVEERLVGPEVSVLALCDGVGIAPLPAARDHKRRFDGDRGPNTGGMGALAPVPIPPEQLEACHAVLRQTVTGMAREGAPFIGVLYGGFMLTDAGPKLLEFNVRFGDPECQPLMMLIDEDPAPWFLGAALGALPGDRIRTRPGAACCVIVSGDAYPERGANAPITALPEETADLVTFQAGTTRKDGQLWATGGRVLGVTGYGATLADARARAYEGVGQVRFDGAAWRTDIGASTLGG